LTPRRSLFAGFYLQESTQVESPPAFIFRVPFTGETRRLGAARSSQRSAPVREKRRLRGKKAPEARAFFRNTKMGKVIRLAGVNKMSESCP